MKKPLVKPRRWYRIAAHGGRHKKLKGYHRSDNKKELVGQLQG